MNKELSKGTKINNAHLSRQSTSSILMIRPVNFAYNEQTALTNYFMDGLTKHQQVHPKAQREFDQFAELLDKNGVNVSVIEAQKEAHSPDSIFPNNWISTHEDGTIFLYPMEAPNRRTERRDDVITFLKNKYDVKNVVDLHKFELQNLYLEGTGSMVLDRENRKAYAGLSSRTSEAVLNEFCKLSSSTPVTFNAVDKKQKVIYHTNVMMSIGSEFAMICTESITKNREAIISSLEQAGKDLVEISIEQVSHFAGNIIELCSKTGDKMIVMSEQAYKSLQSEQLSQLERYGNILFSPLYTIETVGGGSARCMIAEIFLPLRKN